MRIEHLLSFMELTRDANRMFKDYSTGMRQKLAIARGLLTDPEIIFMDEPTNGLDPVSAQKLRKLVKEKFVEEEKKTVIFATHNLHEAEELCDRIAIIHNGEVKVAGIVGDIKREFNSEKGYVIELKRPETDLLERIYRIAHVKKVVKTKDGSLPDTIQIEIKTETREGHEDVFQIIKEIVDMGGKICSFYKKEISLREMFSRVVEKK